MILSIKRSIVLSKEVGVLLEWKPVRSKSLVSAGMAMEWSRNVLFRREWSDYFGISKS